MTDHYRYLTTVHTGFVVVDRRTFIPTVVLVPGYLYCTVLCTVLTTGWYLDFPNPLWIRTNNQKPTTNSSKKQTTLNAQTAHHFVHTSSLYLHRIITMVFTRSRPVMARYDVSSHMVKWWKGVKPTDGQVRFRWARPFTLIIWRCTLRLLWQKLEVENVQLASCRHFHLLKVWIESQK